MGKKLVLGLIVCLILLFSLASAQDLKTEEFGKYAVTSVNFEHQVLDEKNILKFDLEEETIQSISIEWAGDAENFCLENKCFFSLLHVQEASLDEEGFMIVELSSEDEIGDMIYPEGASLTIDLEKGDVVVLQSQNNLVHKPTNTELTIGESFLVDSQGFLNGLFSFDDTSVDGKALLTETGVTLFDNSIMEKQGFLIMAMGESVFISESDKFAPAGDNQFVIKENGFSAKGSGFNIQVANKEYAPEENDFLRFQMQDGMLDVVKGEVLQVDISGDVNLNNGKFGIYRELDDIFYSEDIGPLDSVEMDIRFADIEKNGKLLVLNIEDNKVNFEDVLSFSEEDLVKLRITPEDAAFEYLFAPIDGGELVLGDSPQHGSLGFYQLKAVQRAIGVEETGEFDAATMNALKEWQENYNRENEYKKGSEFYIEENGVWNEATKKAYLEALGNKGFFDNAVLLGISDDLSGLYGPERYFAEVALGEADAYCGYNPELYKVGEPRCAFFIKEFHQSAFYIDPEESGVYGDASIMANNILSHGGEELFYYKDDGLGNFDMDRLQPGDIIFLRKDNFEEFYAEHNCGQPGSDCVYDETFLEAGYSHVCEYMGMDDEGNKVFVHYYGFGVPSVDRFEGDRFNIWQVARVMRAGSNIQAFSDPRHRKYQTTGIRITNKNLNAYDTIEDIYDDLIDAGELDVSQEEKVQLIKLTEDINDVGSVGARKRVLEENTMLYLPTSLGNIEAPDYYQAAALRSNVEEINPTPEWSFLTFSQKISLPKEIKKNIKDNVDENAELSDYVKGTYGSSAVLGSALGNAMSDIIDYNFYYSADPSSGRYERYKTDSPVEFSQLMLSIADENDYGLKEEAALRQGIYGMSMDKMQEIAAELGEEDVGEEIIEKSSKNPLKSTRYVAYELYDIGDYYAKNMEGHVEFTEENIPVVAAAFLTGTIKPRNAAVQEMLIDTGYLSSSFSDSKGQEWDSRDGIISVGGSSYSALEKFAEDYALQHELDADELKKDAEKINDELFISTQLYAVLQDYYKEKTSKDAPLGIVPVQARLQSGEAIEDVVYEIINAYHQYDESMADKGL